jgi:hypothetical protein
MTMRITRILGVGLLALATLSSTSRAGELTYGSVSNNEINAFPFGGNYQNGFGATEYQQVYNASEFGSGVFAINSVTYFNGFFASTLADGTYTVSISTTSAAVNGLSTNMASNIGADNETIFSGSLPSSLAVGAPLTFALATPFDYNPANGNLLVDIQISGVTNDSVAGFYSQSGDFGNLSSRMTNGSTDPGTSYGLVTQFTFTPSVVPEPGTLGMATIALVVAGGYVRHRRQKGAKAGSC